jgi:hypothetical protein
MTTGDDVHDWFYSHEDQIRQAIRVAGFRALDVYVATVADEFAAQLDELDLLEAFPLGYKGAISFARRVASNTVQMTLPDDAGPMLDTE